MSPLRNRLARRNLLRKAGSTTKTQPIPVEGDPVMPEKLASASPGSATQMRAAHVERVFGSTRRVPLATRLLAVSMCHARTEQEAVAAAITGLKAGVPVVVVRDALIWWVNRHGEGA